MIGALFEGAVDIIGDVHGEIGALINLLDRLGYDASGRHPEGRRLVFVGDLVDRGPDSIRVVELVQAWVSAGRAQCVLGNHELNHLRGKRKHGGWWIFGEPEAMAAPTGASEKQISFQTLATTQQHAACLAFFRTLPLALERADLRVVHAAWIPSAIATIRAETRQLLPAFEHFNKVNRARIAALPADIPDDERRLRGMVIDQNDHPIKALTSGLEHGPVPPFFAGGRLRRVARTRWWDDYTDDQLVVFGHYWRRIPPDPAVEPPPAPESDPFKGIDAMAWLGPRGRAMCVDYSVGRRFTERLDGLREGASGCALAALRLTPDPHEPAGRGLRAELVFDSGLRHPCP